MFSCILFDLDGTISDPKQGICGCVQYALRSFGIEEPELDRLEPFIGPPLAESFMKYYNFTAEQAQEAVEKYRERFSVTGKYENVLYPGMGALLHDLKASGATLAIASSKPTVYVEDILVHFGIREYFDIVVGSELDGRRVHKEEVVAEVLSQLAARGESDPDKMVMIGDRSFDVEGAKAIGAHCIAVSYGYAQPGELENAGAEIIVRDVEGLRSVLLGGTEVRLHLRLYRDGRCRVARLCPETIGVDAAARRRRAVSRRPAGRRERGASENRARRAERIRVRRARLQSRLPGSESCEEGGRS